MNKSQKYILRHIPKVSILLLLVMAFYLLAWFHEQLNFNANEQKFLETLATNIRNRCQTYNVPGAAVGVVEEKNIVSLQMHGYSDKTLKNPVNRDSVFQLASISKTFTSWGILKLIDQGKINLEMPIARWITGFPVFSHINSEQITIKMLLNHTSGLSPKSYQGYPISEKLPSLLESINGTQRLQDRVASVYTPGTTFLYAGGNYTLLQYILERITGKTFENYMQERIFIPLDLSNTTFDFSKTDKNKRCTPYGIFGQILPTHQFTEKAAAGLCSSVFDVAKFIAATLKTFNPQKENTSNLTSDSYLEMLQDNDYHYGLGYELEILENGTHLAYHFGANSGWRAGLFILPELGSGITILTNSDNGRYVIEDLAGSWVKWKSGNFPEFYREALVSRYFVKAFLFVLFSVFSLLTVWNEVSLKRGSKNSHQIIFWIILSISWIFIFCSTYVHPNAWVIGAFMPAGFLEMTKMILFFSVINIFVFLTNFKYNKSINKFLRKFQWFFQKHFTCNTFKK